MRNGNKHKRLVLATCAVACGSLLHPSAIAATIFVDADASSGGDGSSWPLAYQHLQDALETAQPGDQIWVAAVVYYPHDGLDDPPVNLREATFAIEDLLSIYGGFDGGELLLTERNPEVNSTILNGDLNHDDFGDVGDLVDPSRDDNSYNVVEAGSVGPDAVLSGFTITGGNANRRFPYDQFAGGGMQMQAGSPTVTRCTFSGNQAGDGGGFQAWAASQPLIVDCKFTNNYCTGYGGGAHFTFGTTATNCQ